MSFLDALRRRRSQQEDKEPPLHPQDWLSSGGTGWGPDHNQPNPFARAFRQVKQDAMETVDDIRDEPSEVPYRLKKRLDEYMPGGRQK